MTQKLPAIHVDTAGRPAFTDAVRARLLTGLRGGLTRKAAAGFAGIHRTTVTRWIAEDPEFAKQVEIAEDVAEAKYTNVVRRDAITKGNAVSALKWLERRRRADWRESVNIIESEMSEEDRAAELGESELDARIAVIVERAMAAAPAAGSAGASDARPRKAATGRKKRAR